MRRFAGISASLFACVAGCGDDGKHHQAADGPLAIDARTIDGAVDGAVDANPAGDVTVSTRARCCTVAPGTPVAAVSIVVVQPDGTLGVGGVTNASGTLTLHGVLPGASITAIYPPDVNQDIAIATTIGVKPGDHLTYGDGYYTIPTTGTAGTMTVNVPVLAAATSYGVYTPCGYFSNAAGTWSTTVTQSATCQVPTGAMAAVAYDGTGAIIASAYLPAANFANDAVVDLPAWTTNTAGNVTTSVSGLLADVNSVQLASYAVLDVNIQLGQSTYPTLAGGAASYAVTLPSALPRTYGYGEFYRPSLDHQFSLKAAAVGGTTVTLTPPTVPWLTSGVLTFDAALGTASWQQTAGTYDAAVLRIGWSRPDMATPPVTHFYNWNVIVPPGVTSFDFGHVPAALAGYVPIATDAVASTNVKLIDLSTTTGYDALRQIPEWQCVHPDGAVEAGDVPAADYSGGEGYAGGIATRHAPPMAVVGTAPHTRR
jgi:hypothetical protein